MTKCSFTTDAKKLCPQLVLVNGEDLSKYRKFSQNVFNLISDFCKDFKCPVERLGLDENFVDISKMVSAVRQNSAIVVSGNIFGEDHGECWCGFDCKANLVVGSILAAQIREKIFQELGLTTSGFNLKIFP